jgi:hypothetical protein
MSDTPQSHLYHPGGKVFLSQVFYEYTLEEEFDRPHGTPTDAPPGSCEKLDIIADRAERGQLLFHPDDRTCFDNGEDE